MPLIVICGKPLTGKSTTAKTLQSFFKEKCLIIVSDEEKLCEQGLDTIYRNAQNEKDLRSWLKSEVQRHLSSPDTVVILDSSNYIKGFRYELYCMCKQFQQTFALIECLPPMDTLDEYELFINEHFDNKTTIEQNDVRIRNYSKEIFDELCERYEPPTASNRWEKPLFRIEFKSEQLPLKEIHEALFQHSKLKPNRSTQSTPMTTDNFIMELDNQTQLTVKQIQTALQLNQLHGIRITGTDVMVNLNRKIPIAELNKFRRQFINYAKLNPFNDKDRIVTAFVQFINNSSNF
ncbi:protein KTI12 homolog [Dermatophagoides farinae]|uniref:Protein KTI12 homolog n=1 Tax=Dermatophagoides farinae TaxID=6954 RepID=A0A9D4SFJ8_DERFA|nr:protein KTI12 homolog [Dermatophagoides farinae]KAH7640389.1 protein kti12-like protein [Dermatophagoides farinae]